MNEMAQAKAIAHTAVGWRRIEALRVEESALSGATRIDPVSG